MRSHHVAMGDTLLCGSHMKQARGEGCGLQRQKHDGQCQPDEFGARVHDLTELNLIWRWDARL
jgi:hypothetical protein